jgi:hypothetical protein
MQKVFVDTLILPIVDKHFFTCFYKESCIPFNKYPTVDLPEPVSSVTLFGFTLDCVARTTALETPKFIELLSPQT